MTKKIFEYIRGNHEAIGEGQVGRRRGWKHSRNDTEQTGVQESNRQLQKFQKKA